MRLPLGPEKMESDVVLLDTSGDKNVVDRMKWWKWADAFVFVYAITDLFSFQQLEDFYREITTCRATDSFTMTVLGIRGTSSKFHILIIKPIFLKIASFLLPTLSLGPTNTNAL